ncbi:MAG: glycosyltransferase [Bacteroidota bacterium]|nr:glycosyltransferase [Bacteroidota bacterium]
MLCEIFPDAPIYTLIAFPDRLSPTIRLHDIRTSFLQSFPFVRSRYRSYLPLFPRAAESLDVGAYDLVVSSSHAVAKGVRPRPGALHVAYIHTPMRYVWDMFDAYFPPERTSAIVRLLIGVMAKRIRAWDTSTSSRVHVFIANSEFVRARIRRFYGRDAIVVHPPVDTNRFSISRSSEGYFLVVSALVPYKRVDLAIEAFNTLRLPLRIVGDGPDRRRLERMSGPTIRFDGWIDDRGIETAYRGCRALVFTGIEDFGIVPVEAMACGKPVIAFRKGGILETVVENVSGTFFDDQTADALVRAVRDFDERRFEPSVIRAHAERFDREVYRRRMEEIIGEMWELHANGKPLPTAF